MGAIVSVKQRARKKTIAIGAFGSQMYQSIGTDGGNKRHQELKEADATSVNKTETPQTNLDENHSAKLRETNDGRFPMSNDFSRAGVSGKDQPSNQLKISGTFENAHKDANENDNLNIENENTKINKDPNSNKISELNSVVFKEPEQYTGNAKMHENVRTKEDQNSNDDSDSDNDKHDNCYSEVKVRDGIEHPSPHEIFSVNRTYNVARNGKLINTSRGSTNLKKSETSNVPTHYKHVQEWIKAVPSDSGDSTPSTPMPMHVAIGSWGEGVIGVTDHSLDNRGYVTSRGIHANVQSSATIYTDFALVSSLSYPSQQEKANVNTKPICTGWKYGCLCEKCKAERKRVEAALIIQKCFRGHQTRKTLLKQRKSIIKIQRLFRERVESNEKLKVYEADQKISQTGKEDLKFSKPSRRTSSPTPSLEIKVAGKAKENFHLYQEDITELKWKSQRLIEQATMGDDYMPQILLLIASNVGQTNYLARATHEDVNVIVYQFSEITLQEILQNISLALNDYRNGSRAKRIAFVCQGGPGYMYLCRGKVLTTAKLAKDNELQNFVKVLGTYISKIDPDNAKIHIIGNNISGSKKGTKLLEDVTEVMRPSRVSIESPIEISAAGKKMLEEYFDIEQYRLWKRIKHTKIWV